MLLYSKSLLFYYCLLDDFQSLYTILVAICLYFSGCLSYFIFFVFFLSAKKIHTLLRFSETNKKDYYIFDFFQIGSVFVLLTDKFKQQNNLFMFKYRWILFQVVFQGLFFFCFKTLDNRNIQSYVIISSYLNFILSVLQLIVTVSLFSKQNLESVDDTYTNKEQLFRFFVATFVYYISICTLTFSYDNNGINLGYYQLILILSNFVVLGLLYICFKKILIYSNLNEYFWSSLYISIDFSLINMEYEQLEDMIGSIITYFNQIVRIVLIIIYSFKQSEQSLNQQQDLQQQIKQVFALTSLIFSIVYLLINFKDLIKYIFRQRFFKVKCLSDLEKVTSDLNKNCSNTKIYRIFFIENQMNETCADLEQNQYSQFLKFWQSVSLLQQQNKTIHIEFIDESWMENNNIDILTSVENIHNEFFAYAESQIKNLKSIDHIILKRVENGFVDNKFTQKLLQRYNISDKTYIQESINQMLSINAYYQHLQQHMIYNPHQILYDLYIN